MPLWVLNIANDYFGRISWVMREGAALVCPKSGYSASTGGQNTTTTSQYRVGEISTNKKQRLAEEPIRKENQSDTTDGQ